MNALLSFTAERSTAITSIADLSIVRIVSDVDTGSGFVKAGSMGTVVNAHCDGEAYSVEITSPFHAVLTIKCEELEVVGGSKT